MAELSKKPEDIDLTPDELEMLRLAALGLSNEDIGKKFYYSGKAIQRYLGKWDSKRSIYSKIGVIYREQAVSWYVQRYGDPNKSDHNNLLGENAKGILQKLVLSGTYSIEEVAIKAGVEPEFVSKLINEESIVNTSDRGAFLKLLGLIPFLLSNNPSLSLEVGSQKKGASIIDPHEFGTRLILEAIELTRNYSWEKAILIYFEVEKILGLASSLAPWAALQAVLLQVTLGDFTQALMDITRIENTYLSIMDPETKAELHIVKGWVNYYQGNYAQAETCFSEPLAIALETGTERLAKDAEHFLGRLYCDWGQSFSQKQQNESLFHNSKSHLEEAYRLHSKFGTEINQAFDLFRKAQLQQVRNNAREARQLRDTARQMFGKDKAVLHIDMEEAKIAVADREYVESKVKAERALSGWSEVKYAKGIADSIKILGEANYIQGKLAPALELFLASLCIYPYKNLANQQLWTKIIQLKSIILQQVNRNGYEKIMLQIQESMNERSGYFSYLNRLIVDRTPDISQILSRWDEVNKKNKLSNCPIYSLG